MELDGLLERATAAIDEAADIDALSAAEKAFVGKKGELTLKKKELGSLEPDVRKAAGQALNDAISSIIDVAAVKRELLVSSGDAERLESERLDLTESLAEIRRGHLHLVTQARDRLEDVFVGMGFTVAEGSVNGK